MGHTFYGVTIISSPLATTLEPVRKHIKTVSMSETYHKRVQKKWVKRWGVKHAPGAYRTPAGIVAHPDVIEALRRECRWVAE